MTSPTPKPNILNISPYVGGDSKISGLKQIIKLSSNEGALGPSPKAMEAFNKEAKNLHRYPDSSAAKLREAIAETYGLDPDRIVCGSGSDELIDLLARAYSGPGDEVIHTEHGFLMYSIAAKGAGAKPISVPEKNLRGDVDSLIKRAGKDTKILYLANPNNPTGTYLADTDIRRLRDGLPDHVLLVIDSAYAEYVTRNDYKDGKQLVEDFNNVVMTRTFSKIFALGGIRLGWAYCPREVADVLNRLRGPFNVSSPAMAAGIAAIRDIAFTDEVRTHMEKWYKWTKENLIELGLEVPSQVGNFLLVRFPDDPDQNAEATNEFFRTRGIIVRRMTEYSLPECLRITIGKQDEMQKLLITLKEFRKR